MGIEAGNLVRVSGAKEGERERERGREEIHKIFMWTFTRTCSRRVIIMQNKRKFSWTYRKSQSYEGSFTIVTNVDILSLKWNFNFKLYHRILKFPKTLILRVALSKLLLDKKQFRGHFTRCNIFSNNTANEILLNTKAKRGFVRFC